MTLREMIDRQRMLSEIIGVSGREEKIRLEIKKELRLNNSSQSKDVSH